MSDFTYSLIHEPNWLLARLNGGMPNLEQMLEFSHNVLDTARQKGYGTILHDMRGLKTLGTTLDIVHAANHFKTLPESLLQVRTAMLVNQDNWESARFIETTFRNRGVALRMFTDMESAGQWLKTGEAQA